MGLWANHGLIGLLGHSRLEVYTLQWKFYHLCCSLFCYLYIVLRVRLGFEIKYTSRFFIYFCAMGVLCSGCIIWVGTGAVVVLWLAVAYAEVGVVWWNK